ncbi:type II secretion system protein [Candidatus Daviesbacteria bacterium]|nr:type II secretion system protein [Candidatus Daviesbacteria bacterium]
MSARLKPKGFTLIELLVVISILAILSVVGMAVFAGVSKNARDAKRKADVDAMAKALEVKKTINGYTALTANDFSSGSLPRDPDSNYCDPSGYNIYGTVIYDNGGCAKWIAGSGTFGYVVCGLDTFNYPGGTPTDQGCSPMLSSARANFYICTRMEGDSGGNYNNMWLNNPQSNGPTYCRRSQQ